MRAVVLISNSNEELSNDKTAINWNLKKSPKFITRIKSEWMKPMFNVEIVLVMVMNSVYIHVGLEVSPAET